MNQDELRKLIECYRTEPDAQGAAEFAALREAIATEPAVREQFEAVQAWDVAIGKAMHEVPVPAGLAERLLAATDPAIGQPPTQPPPETDQVALARRARKGWWSRWPARVAAAATCAAALVTLFFYIAVWNDTLTSAQVAQSACGWIGQLDEEGWRQSVPPRNEYQHRALAFPLDGWQPFTALGDSNAIAYRATLRRTRARALLLVIATHQGRQLPTQPPSNPVSTTGNICIGVWKSGGHIYVLAVQGTPQTYRRLLKLRAIAQAVARPAKANARIVADSA